MKTHEDIGDSRRSPQSVSAVPSREKIRARSSKTDTYLPTDSQTTVPAPGASRHRITQRWVNPYPEYPESPRPRSVTVDADAPTLGDSVYWIWPPPPHSSKVQGPAALLCPVHSYPCTPYCAASYASTTTDSTAEHTSTKQSIHPVKSCTSLCDKRWLALQHKYRGGGRTW